MLPDFLEKSVRKIVVWWRKSGQIKPLVGYQHDLKLVRKVRQKNLPNWGQIRRAAKVLSPLEKRAVIWCLTIAGIGISVWAFLFVFERLEWLPTRGGEYREAVIGSPQLINPLYNVLNDVDVDLSRLIYSGLMRYDEKQRVIQDLAVKHEISEDGKQYTFYLRKDAFWHDGEKFDAQDVVFTVEAVQNPAVASPLYISFQGVKVEALDDFTVKFTLNEVFPSFLSTMTIGILPEHIWYDIPAERMRLAPQNLQPIGTGPFKFKKLAKDATGYIYHYELERFDSFYRQPVYLDNVVFNFFSEYDGAGGAIDAIRAQKVDGLSFVPLNLKDKVERKHINLRTLELPQYTALFFNAEEQPFLEQKETRLALAQAIDKVKVLKESLQGEGQVIHSPVLPGFPGFQPELSGPVYNLEEANTLLDKNWQRVEAEKYRETKKEELLKNLRANWSVENNVATSTETGTSTILMDEEKLDLEAEETLNKEINEAQIFYRQNKKGEWLVLELVTADTAEYRRTAELLAGFWQEIGVKTELKFLPTRDIPKDALKNRSYDMLLYGEIIGNDPDQYPFWHSSQINFPGLNLSRYVNRNADAILVKARETVNQDETADLYKKFQEIIMSDLPAVFLYMPTYTYALSDKIKGVDATRISAPADRFADITTWYIKTKAKWQTK